MLLKTVFFLLKKRYQNKKESLLELLQIRIRLTKKYDSGFREEKNRPDIFFLLQLPILIFFLQCVSGSNEYGTGSGSVLIQG